MKRPTTATTKQQNTRHTHLIKEEFHFCTFWWSMRLDGWTHTSACASDAPGQSGCMMIEYNICFLIPFTFCRDLRHLSRHWEVKEAKIIVKFLGDKLINKMQQ